ncbi:MAG: response regulator [Acidobacteria bacterium]|nr:response regulator [Acidobacteriota bacterium]
MSRKSVLLVDDDPVFIEAVRAVLETRYEISTASNGTEALAALDKSLPDLMVLDVMMDHLSEGFDVARRVKRTERTAGIPIIILTGVDSVYNYRMEVGEAWVDCEKFLEKPVSPTDLLKHVAEVIG